MRASPFLGGVALECMLVGLGAFSPQPLDGQQVPTTLPPLQFGVGYVANAPEMMAGGGAYVISHWLGGIGIYLDAKFDLDSPENDIDYRGDLTVSEVEDELGYDYIKEDKSWRSFNVALIRPLNPFLMVYGGVGYAESTVYPLYEDVEFDVGRAVRVKAPGEGSEGLNLMGGMMMRVSSLVETQFGVETRPRGITVGASLKFPKR